MKHDEDKAQPAPVGQVERGVGRPEPERADGSEHYGDDRDEPFDEPTCERCHGDGMDPWCDYMMPCPLCQGERR